MAFNPADIKAEMPTLRWRSIEVPCSFANISGSIVQARRPYAYLDVTAHEGVRIESEVIDAELLFFNTVQPNSFPDLFRTFYKAVRDKSIGDMNHPVRGFLRAKVISYGIPYTAQDRAGCIMQVRWEETREDASTPPAEVAVPPDAKEVAREADVAVEAVRVLYPTGDDAPLGTDDAIVVKGDAFAAAYDQAFAALSLQYPTGDEPETIEGLFDAVLGDVQSKYIVMSGRFARAADVVAQIADAVELLEDPFLWPALDVLRQAWRAIDELATSYGEGDRPVGRYVANRDMPLDEIADLLKVRLDDLITLNPTALSSPWVFKGAVVRYYLA